MSYKEFEDGQCWQVDPVSGNAKETNLGDNGGWYKSIDNTNTMNPIFFTTEDHNEGAIHHFVANDRGCSLHSNRDEQFLRIIDDNTYKWTTDKGPTRDSTSTKENYI